MPEDPTRRLLRLLADAAGAAEIAQVDADEQDRALALAATRHLEHQRRRERELLALVETARELAATADPDGVLEAIVRRARQLLGSDVAYLTLFDPDRGDTYMRTTDGATASTFMSLRLGLGDGLGGLVASTHQPWWSPDYPDDTRFAHTAPIDAGVADEGLVAICGTPLLVGGRFVGVLFAAYRSRHTFGPEELALLGSLATLAAVSIVQSRALHDTQDALDALSAAHAESRAQAEAIERSVVAHDRFVDLVLSGSGVEGITRALGEALGGWVVLVDADGSRRSAFGPVPDEVEVGDSDPLGLGTLVETARSSGRVAVQGCRYAVSARSRHTPLATITGGGRELDEADRRIVERAGVVTALVLLFERDTAAARQRAVSDLVADLVEGALAEPEAHRQLRAQGFDPTRDYCLVVLRPTLPAVSSLVMAAGAALGELGVVGEHDQVAVALASGSDPAGAAARLVERLRSFGEVTAAGVGPLQGISGIAEALEEARRTVDAMTALGRRGESATTHDLGFAGLIVGSTPDVGDYVRRVLGAVLDYDRDKGTELVTTLEEFFASGRSAHRAAGPLHVHVNTVTQRLSRLTALLGDDWTEPDRSLEIQLALRLRRLLPVSGAAGGRRPGRSPTRRARRG